MCGNLRPTNSHNANNNKPAGRRLRTNQRDITPSRIFALSKNPLGGKEQHKVTEKKDVTGNYDRKKREAKQEWRQMTSLREDN